MKVSRYFNCNLVGGAGGGTLTRGVADSWSVSSDGRTIDFVIADGIKAHDGSDITVEDAWWRFEFAFGEAALNRPGVDPTSIALAQVSEAIQIVDGNTLRLSVHQPST